MEKERKSLSKYIHGAIVLSRVVHRQTLMDKKLYHDEKVACWQCLGLSLVRGSHGRDASNHKDATKAATGDTKTIPTMPFAVTAASVLRAITMAECLGQP